MRLAMLLQCILCIMLIHVSLHCQWSLNVLTVCFSLAATAVTVVGNSVLLMDPSELAALKQVTRYLVRLPRVPGELAVTCYFS